MGYNAKYDPRPASTHILSATSVIFVAKKSRMIKNENSCLFVFLPLKKKNSQTQQNLEAPAAYLGAEWNLSEIPRWPQSELPPKAPRVPDGVYSVAREMGWEPLKPCGVQQSHWSTHWEHVRKAS